MKAGAKKVLILFAVVIVILTLVFLFYKGYFSFHKQDVPSNSGKGLVSLVRINYTNIEAELSKTEFVNAIPQDAEFLLKFYNFNSGERQWERFYVIKKGQIVETLNPAQEAEVTLVLNSKYLEELTNINFCSVIKKANQNGDLGVESNMSSSQLAWKFKSMYEYKDCFGF